MTAQILGSELSTLLQESKRKLPELRNAAEKSLQDLKALPVTSETQLAADLTRRPQFIDPFLIACSARNGKYAAIGVACLQRLAVSIALPRSRLKEVVDALKECTSLGLEIQLKILQTLPPLLQNYSEDVHGTLLFTALETCSALQASKTQTISSTAAATIQQLVLSIFDRLAAEDGELKEVSKAEEVTVDNERISVSAVAYDNYRVFHDLCLLAQGGNMQYVQFSTSPSGPVLELLEAVITNHSECFRSHPELSQVLKISLLPFLIKSFSEKQNFASTVRTIRLVYLITRQYVGMFAGECEAALCLLVQMLEPDASAPWKRVLCLEVFRGIFSDHTLLLQIHERFNENHQSKNVLRYCLGAFVRLASEKPALIGLGQYSTLPVGNFFQRETTGERFEEMATTSNSTNFGVPAAPVPGISMQFSSVKIPCIDQLDKTDPPPLPDTYVYSLVLTCLTGLSESLTNFVLPLTVQASNKSKKRSKLQELPDAEATEELSSDNSRSEVRKDQLKRSHSYRRRTIPENPLFLDDHPATDDIQTAASLVEDCWPAVLACCSTFFNASLDSDYYRALVRSFQKFAQVIGLLRMSTPRDAFLTTLSKASIPSHLLATNFTKNTSPTSQNSTVFSSAKSFLNVDNIVSQASTLLPDRARRSSLDSNDVSLNARNLLCLRALLNLAIALGPLLDSSWSIVLETMQQAETMLAAPRMRPVSRDRAGVQTPTQASPEASVSPGLSSEIVAVQAAAKRLFESTADFPNESFRFVLQALCNLIHVEQLPSSSDKPATPQTPTHQRRVSSFSTISIRTETQGKDLLFVLEKLREVGTINLDRFLEYEPSESGWKLIVDAVKAIAVGSSNSTAPARLSAADIVSRLSQQVFSASLSQSLDVRNALQQRALSTILAFCNDLLTNERESDNSSPSEIDLQVHSIALEALRNILERGGDSLTGAWRIVFETISTAFSSQPQRSTNIEGTNQDESFIDSALHSISIGHSAFSSVQLTCSDFLNTVPDDDLFPLTNLLSAFASQTQDVNISLTTTTLFWNLSDFLYEKGALRAFEPPRHVDHSKLATDTEIILQMHEATLPDEDRPLTSLWLLVLRRITSIINDSREEVRNAAVHTILRIFDSHGDEFLVPTWQLCLDEILFRIMVADVQSYSTIVNSGSHPDQPHRSVEVLKARMATSKIIIEGICKLIGTHLGTIAQIPHFHDKWRQLMDTLERYLQLQLTSVAAAVCDAISMTLSSLPSSEMADMLDVEQIFTVWKSSFRNISSQANQEVLLAFSKLFKEIYRLQPSVVDNGGINEIAQQLEKCVCNTGMSAYSTDVDSLALVQAATLESFAMIHTENAVIALPIVEVLANFLAAPFTDTFSQSTQSANSTFIALCKSSMDLVELLIKKHIEEDQLITQPPLLLVLEHLERPIGLKYSWATQGRAPALWQKATSTSIEILRVLVPRLGKVSLHEKIMHRYWKIIIQIIEDISQADAHIMNQAQDGNILDDEQFDIESLKAIHSIVIPNLGASSISDFNRRTYVCALFRNSLLHSLEEDDLPNFYEAPLAGLYEVRFGRTYKPDQVPRFEMAYCCLEQLISLVSISDSSSERIKLAQAAAPLLILRATLPLKAYIADQPLRGGMPQPKSEREELLFVLRRMREMKIEPKGIPELQGVKSTHRKHLLWLYPLISQAVGIVNNDPLVLKELQVCLAVIGDGFGL